MNSITQAGRQQAGVSVWLPQRRRQWTAHVDVDPQGQADDGANRQSVLIFATHDAARARRVADLIRVSISSSRRI